MNNDQAFVFLDTMMYLHWQPVENIPWPDVLGNKAVTIVVPYITVHELDEHKCTHPSQKIRDRAASQLKTIHECITQGRPLREGVTLKDFKCSIDYDYSASGLDRNWNDDVLIAAILDFKNMNADTRVVLLSNDTGPKLHAHRFGIECIDLDEKYRIPPEEDLVLKENRELKNEILRIQAASPQLAVCFQDNESSSFQKYTLKRVKESTVMGKDEMAAKLRAKFPKMSPPLLPAPKSPLASHSIISGLEYSIIPKREYERYNDDVDEYIARYLAYHKELINYRARSERMISLAIAVRNTGGAPAEDVDVHIHFPDGFEMFTDDNLPDEPSAPIPPQKPRTSTEILRSQIKIPNLAADLFRPPFHSSTPNTFRLDRTNSYDLKDHLARIKHGYIIKLRTLHIVFNSYDEAASFGINYLLSAANMPTSAKGQLNIVIERA